MHRSLSVVCAILMTVAAAGTARPQETRSDAEDGQAILVRTVRLTHPVENARQLTLYGVLGGDGSLTLDPNYCQLSEFGDDEICTEIAPIHRQVRITRQRIADPLGRNRALYAIENAGLMGRLYLVVPDDSAKDAYRFVYENENGRRAITGERLVYDRVHVAEPQGSEGLNGIPIIDLVESAEKKCEHIDFEGTPQVIGGFINDTYLLFVEGTKPSLSMRVKLLPRRYGGRPEYWAIDLVGCVEGDITLPATGPFLVEIPLAGITGTKGVAVVGKSKAVKLDVPPRPRDEQNRSDAKEAKEE